MGCTSVVDSYYWPRCGCDWYVYLKIQNMSSSGLAISKYGGGSVQTIDGFSAMVMGIIITLMGIWPVKIKKHVRKE